MKKPFSSRRVLLTVGLATGLSLLGDTALYTVLPSNAVALGLSIASLGILLSANRFIRLVLNGPFGFLVDRWPRRRMFVPSVFIGALSTAIYAMSGDYWLFLFGRLLWGVAWAGLWVSGNAIVLDVTTEHNRGGRVGVYHLSFFLGAASGALLGGLLTDWIGFRPAMSVAASLTFVGAVVAWLLLPETKVEREITETTPTLKESTKNKDETPQLFSAVALFGVNRVVMAGVLFATFGFYLADQFGQTIIVLGREVGVASLTGIALSTSTIIGMIAAPITGTLSDRLQSRWSVAGGGLLVGMTGFTLISIGSPLAISLGLPMASFASGSNQGMSTSLIGDLTIKARHGRRLGLLFTLGDLASAVGPPIAYGLQPVIGLRNVYILCVVLIAMMAVVAFGWTIRRMSDNQFTNFVSR